MHGKQVSLEWTETSLGLWKWWQDRGVPLAFPVESASSGDATGTPETLSRPHRERIPPLELEGGNRATLVHGFNIFGAKAVFSMGACRLFPQYVLAITLLVGSEPGVAMTIACTG